ncbi:hypothetical protein LTR47_011216 [Exophiala xenobiotica]|nr:hypothetical protein LTR92_011087 [Exophiala xenobiotica]KAK5220350.1 hypothetical protein LTR47_011216 [Exophiala xenobiotica]KAK5245321.1 hypothetical protein LTS06_009235 [Exophiala xenobiotica]KAK5260697.1 hypothetical protein LTR40_003650 [Exophiala xenobiotica]KAK5345004.1 hypothetical protein LTR61_011232 [Exophiala xenobiotica]
MKTRVRFRILVFFLLLVTAAILLAVLEDKCETYRPFSFIEASIPWLKTGREAQLPVLVDARAQGKIIVVPALQEENVSWVLEDLPDWKHAIYIVNPLQPRGEHSDMLTTPVDKGRKAMAYLSYIIDNYNSGIPSIVAFLHAHRNGFFQAWHVDTPLHDNVVAMRSLRLDYVQKKGYVNLRCNWNPGCKRVSRPNPHINGEVWREVFDGTSTPVFVQNRTGPASIPGTSSLEDREKLRYTTMNIWTPCCAQFAVTSERIYERPLADYVKIRRWVMDTEKDDAHSGRVMEYLWHVIFGREAVQ